MWKIGISIGAMVTGYSRERRLVRIVPRQLAEEAIAASRNSFNQGAFRPAIVEDTAQARDLDGQVAVFDHCPGPDHVHDLISRDEIAGAIDQYAENIEGSPADRDGHENALLIP